MNNEPDFKVRNLEDYTEKDLDYLFVAVSMCANHFRHDQSEEFKQSLNVWQYRIKDAMSVARKREAETRPPKEDDSLLSSFKGIFK